MRPGASRRAVLALLLAVPMATGSCAPSTLRTGLLEERIARELQRRLERPGIVVTCPARIEVRRGDVFECVAISSSGERLRIRVTQVDDDGGVSWETAGLDG